MADVWGRLTECQWVYIGYFWSGHGLVLVALDGACLCVYVCIGCIILSQEK